MVTVIQTAHLTASARSLSAGTHALSGSKPAIARDKSARFAALRFLADARMTLS